MQVHFVVTFYLKSVSIYTSPFVFSRVRNAKEIMPRSSSCLLILSNSLYKNVPSKHFGPVSQGTNCARKCVLSCSNSKLNEPTYQERPDEKWFQEMFTEKTPVNTNARISSGLNQHAAFKTNE